MVIEEELFQLFVNNSELTSNDVVRRLHQRVMTSHLSKALPNVDPSEIVAIASQSKGSQYKANSIIVQQGEFGDRVYLILEGEVEISVIDQGDPEQFNSNQVNILVIYNFPVVKLSC